MAASSPVGFYAGAAATMAPIAFAVPQVHHAETASASASNPQVDWTKQLLPVFLILAFLGLMYLTCSLGSKIHRLRKRKSKVPDVAAASQAAASFMPPALAVPPPSAPRNDLRLALEPHLALDARYMGYVSQSKLLAGTRRGIFG
ncbi:hypothetical protein DFH07DRAFT_965100 [Mycena maculata]|uniref:Uncharacterized protein n=1 Tax=Mycena maculata TaxID=230809 RepID=A0AAD7IGG2_9AGAR|nr:hypothetical protein DFH07DRAFT_965100 [Mycena maculata]